ncbi:hypothetical protein COOONC_06862 [Cooperia oncophora]
MDGRLHALDAVNGGRVVWVADFDAEALLCGTLGKVQPMKVDGRLFNLIPALDGTLYMYSRDEHLLEPIPLNTDLLLQASIRVGHDAVAGGRTISTTGVDPLTGEVRYHCSSSHCDSLVTDPVSSTLVFRRSTSKVRAVDALTGHERWNLSVSEYDATLVTLNRGELYPRGARIRYLVQPPDGIVTAYDQCGNELWSRQLGSHIAHTWKLEGGELSEVSLFNTENIHTLSITDGRPGSAAGATPRSESLFYLGSKLYTILHLILKGMFRYLALPKVGFKNECDELSRIGIVTTSNLSLYLIILTISKERACSVGTPSPQSF